MSWRSLLSVFALAVLASASSAITVLDTAVYNGHTYKLLSTDSWTASEAFATSIGGHLATIGDAAENAFVFGTFSGFGGRANSLWIGYHNTAPSGPANFAWTSGETPGYTNWDGGEPNHYVPGELYTLILGGQNGTHAGLWNDESNVAQGAYQPTLGVVEISSVPGPLAALPFGLMALARRRRRA